MNDVDPWIENFQYIYTQKQNQTKTNINQSGGSATGFNPGYAALIGENISSVLDQKGANPFVKAMVTVIITILAVIVIMAVIMVLLYLMVRNRIDEIRADWPNQRCSAKIIPIASWVGPPGTSIGGNAKECLNDFMGKFLEKKFRPLFVLFNKIFGILGSITNSIQQVRVMIYTIRSTIMKMAQDVYKKIKDVYYRIAYLVKRVMQIIIYIFLTFRNVFMVLKYSLWTLQSITDFWLFSWCFHEKQIIPSRLDSYSKWNYDSCVADLRVGHSINPQSTKESKVVGIWKFQHPFSTSKWVHPNKNPNWTVSPGHYVYDNDENKWVCEETDIVLTDNSPFYCPWSHSGYIQNQDGDYAMDYWGPGTTEFEYNYFMKTIQKRQQEGFTLDYQADKLRNALIYRRWASMSLFQPQTFVETKDGFIPLEKIKLGQVMHDNGVVNGICEADSNEYQWINYNGLICTAGTWIKENNVWESATNHSNIIAPTTKRAMSISTTTGNLVLKVNQKTFVVKDGIGWFTQQEDAKHYRALINEL